VKTAHRHQHAISMAGMWIIIAHATPQPTDLPCSHATSITRPMGASLGRPPTATHARYHNISPSAPPQPAHGTTPAYLPWLSHPWPVPRPVAFQNSSSLPRAERECQRPL
jgi:hypothetical protein